MGLREDLKEAAGITLADAVRRMIDGKYILGYGIIEEVMADGIVLVSPSVIRGKEEYTVCPCVLGTVASSSCTVNITPNVKDKVLIFYPRLYDHKMFLKETEGAVVNPSDSGYSPFTGIAFLFNQYQTKTHKNRVTVAGGAVEGFLCYDAENSSEDEDIYNHMFKTLPDGSFESRHAYSKDDSLFRINLKAGSDGSVLLESALKDGKYASILSISAEGAFTYTNPKASISVLDDGVIEIKNENATVTVDASGNISFDSKGKFTLKNNGVSLKDVIDGLAQEVNNLITVGSPATQKTSPATQAKITAWQNTKLNQFFEG